jgi:hypothetical protein
MTRDHCDVTADPRLSAKTTQMLVKRLSEWWGYLEVSAGERSPRWSRVAGPSRPSSAGKMGTAVPQSAHSERPQSRSSSKGRCCTAASSRTPMDGDTTSARERRSRTTRLSHSGAASGWQLTARQLGSKSGSPGGPSRAELRLQ